MTNRLEGKRVLITQAADYMGPATIELFNEHGAEVIADESDLTQPGAVQGIVDAAGHIDVIGRAGKRQGIVVLKFPGLPPSAPTGKSRAICHS